VPAPPQNCFRQISVEFSKTVQEIGAMNSASKRYDFAKMDVPSLHRGGENGRALPFSLKLKKEDWRWSTDVECLALWVHAGNPEAKRGDAKTEHFSIPALTRIESSGN